MALQLDEEETEFFSAALSFLDDFPASGSVAAHANAALPLEHAPQRFEELSDDCYLPTHVGNGSHSDHDNVSTLSSLDGVELQGLAEMCLPTAADVHGLVDSQSTAIVATTASSSWDMALCNISKSFTPEPVNTTAAAKKEGIRPRASPRPRAKSKDKAPASDKGKAKSHLPYNPNKARDERKLELIYLRKKVKEMEEQLETLHQTRGLEAAHKGKGGKPAVGARRKRLLGANATINGDKKASQALCVSALAPPRSSSLFDGAASSLPSVWKELCLRQLQRRVKAERENARLKRELESQIKVAKSMEKLLNKPSGVKVGPLLCFVMTSVCIMS